MFDFNFYLSYDWIYWTRPTGPPSALPEGIERSFVQTPHGSIELLCAKPNTSSSSSSSSSPSSKRRSTTTSPHNVVVFAHGGMGAAWVWTPYMLYLARRGVTSYAVSTRGHGESWHPTFLRMLYATTKREFSGRGVDGIIVKLSAGDRVRVTDVGQFGDVGVTQLLDEPKAYQARASLAELSNFSGRP